MKIFLIGCLYNFFKFINYIHYKLHPKNTLTSITKLLMEYEIKKGIRKEEDYDPDGSKLKLYFQNKQKEYNKAIKIKYIRNK